VKFVRLALALSIALWFGLHVLETQRANINWDEYALLARSVTTLRSEQVQGGGRPGLVTLVLCAVVPHFDNEVQAVNAARLLWVLPTGFLVLAVFLIGRRLASAEAGMLAAFLLVSLPTFARWSLQVRTDQMAAAFGFGALLVCLPLSRLGPSRAVLGGFLAGLGWLSSQKAAYVIGFMGLLALHDWLRSRVPVRRLLIRGACFGAGGALAMAAMNGLVHALGWKPPPPYSLQDGLAKLASYSSGMGWSMYYHQIPYLAVHIVILVVAISIFAYLYARRPGAELFLVAGMVAYAVIVTYFHKAAFPYFFIVLAPLYVLPAAIAIEWIRRAETGRAATGLVLAVMLAGVAVSVPEHRTLLQDTQRVQRDVAEIAQAATRAGIAGFQSENALFYGPAEFHPYFPSVVTSRILARGEEGINDFMNKLEAEKVKYIVLSSFGFVFLPKPIMEHIAANYFPVHSRVLVHGIRIPPIPPLELRSLHVAEAGNYRFRSRFPRAAIEIDGRPVLSGDVVHLSAGEHLISASYLPAGALLVWDVPLAREIPPDGDMFYSLDQLTAFEGAKGAAIRQAFENAFMRASGPW
jgi:hypothetical protein